MQNTSPNTPACTRQQMAARYGVHRNTFLRWLRRHGIDLPRGLIRPKDQQRIIRALGEPPYPASVEKEAVEP